MKRKLKFLGMIVTMFIMCVVFSKNNAYAYLTKGDKIGNTNLITLPWHPGTPNLYWHFYFSDTGQTVFCVQPHVVFNGGHQYSATGKYAGDVGRQLSYAYENTPAGLSWEEGMQVRQATIWALSGWYDIYSLDRNNHYANLAIQLYEAAKANANGADINNQMSTYTLNFNKEGSNWVSNWVYIKSGASVSCSMGSLQRDGDNWRVVVPDSAISNVTNVELYSWMSTRRYNEADTFDGPNNAGPDGQKVIITGGSYEDARGDTARGTINPLGNLTIAKTDNYGTYKAGAKFKVSGPGGTWEVTTDGNGRAYLNNILKGNYTITETQAPANMKNEESGRAVSVTVNAGSTTTYTRQNGYPRGSVRLVKYDADHRGATLGNATLAGAKFNLCAAADIYEGATKIYSKDQVIKSVTTDANGNTTAVTNLPIGTYYYKETQASTGFLLNTNTVSVSVVYGGQYTFTIGEKAVEIGEKPIYGNIKITKKLGALDYDSEILLAGSRFKATLKSNNNQVYYSTTSGADGICTFSNLPYGTYTIEEYVVPASAEKIANFDVSITENGKTYEYTKVDTSKDMKIAITKQLVVNENWKTDATVQGAEFTVYRDAACTNKVCVIGPTDANGYAISAGTMRTGTYYIKETKFPTGINPNATVPGENVTYKDKVYSVTYDNTKQGTELVTVPITIKNEPIYGSIETLKRLGALDYDIEINLKGAQFKATLKSDRSQVHYSNVSGADGICKFNNLPYGNYEIEECVVPPEAEKIPNYDCMISEQGKTYNFTKVDTSKDMKIEVNKTLVVNENWKTDAVVEGAEFTVYRDAACTNKVCVIGPTNADGYAISAGTMRTGTYYLKETKFPVGINPDAKVPGENVTYRNKVYSVTYDNTQQGTEQVTVPITIVNEPIYGNIEILKRLGALDYDPEINLKGAQFKATLKSDTTQVHYSNVSGADGICEFIHIPYGDYEIEEYVVPNEAEKIANFDCMISEEGKTYEFTKVDLSKDMKIEVFKQILVHEGEKTDAIVEGAEFTVYRDAACTNKVCVIGPTDENGYAISGTMRTGTYYLKETKFPIGIDPDATIPGEDVTYRNKVYSVTYNNAVQGTELVTVSLTVQNEPKRNDIQIFKEIGATSNTPQFPLDKCEFTATLISSIGTDEVFSRKCTLETDRNGYCIIEDLPYGEYVVEETKVSPISLKCDNFETFVEEDRKVKTDPYYKNIVDEPKVMQIKMRKVDANRKDTDAPDFTQGDGVLKGAIYQIFRYDPQTDDYTEPVYEITVDHQDADGYWCAESKDLLVGKYMVKEKISHTEEVDGKTYDYSYAEGYLSDPETYYFDQRPDLQTGKRTFHYDTSKEEVIRGSVEVIKYDNNLNSSDETPSKGAILRLTLDSNPDKYYDAVINEHGYAEFVEEESREKYYPNTIPYGKYTITEVKESDKEEHTSFFIQPEDVVITKQVQKEYRIEADEPVEMYLQIQKTDKDTGADVKIAGAKFKVWNCETDSWVSQITYPSGNYIDEFETGKDGKLTLPHKLESGDYIVYETQAPAGYYLEEAWRIPEKESDIGNADVAGKYVRIDKAAMNVVENTAANRLDLYYEVEMPNEPLKGRLEIIKTGEMLTDANVNATEYGDKYVPVYNHKGLEGVTYDIIAAEDIKSPDGNVTYILKGTKVDTITTGEDGIAITKDLYLGEYEIKEIATPIGYITDTNIENVVLENEDTLTRVEVTEKSLTNVRQKLKLTFKKAYDEVDFANAQDLTRFAVFGVYSSQDIKNSEGTIVIHEDDLVDVIRIEGDEEDATSTIDLPEGKYYVQEIDASYPYSLSEEIREVELKYSGNTDEYITYETEGFSNEYEKATLALVKVSTSNAKDLTLQGNEIVANEFDVELEDLLQTLKILTLDEAAQYLKEANVKFVAGAKYKVYIDKDCTQPLYIKSGEEFVEAEVVTNETGMIILEEIPLGRYFIKEVEAPKGYEVSENVATVVLTRDDKESLVYRALTDVSVRAKAITKTDIFTGEVVPDCTFEIKDEEGNILLHTITDGKGEAYIPLDIFEDGKTYTYTEIDAPEIYNLNTDPHEFVAKFDENREWAVEKMVVENVRKTSNVTLEKLDFADSKPIPNCKFELRSLETDFVVEGVTDENGIYVFENIPYGKYTYTELEAPEEYMIDTEPHEITIDAEEMKIQVTNEKAPETGDIQVVAIAGILVISMLGIVYTLKNKKLVK